jgi:hypothetical protein
MAILSGPPVTSEDIHSCYAEARRILHIVVDLRVRAARAREDDEADREFLGSRLADLRMAEQNLVLTTLRRPGIRSLWVGSRPARFAGDAAASWHHLVRRLARRVIQSIESAAPLACTRGQSRHEYMEALRRHLLKPRTIRAEFQALNWMPKPVRFVPVFAALEVEFTRTERRLARTDPPQPRFADRTLSVGRRAGKRFRADARNPTLILEAFQEQGWPTTIRSPLTDPDKVNDTVKALNAAGRSLGIRFSHSGKGSRCLIQWFRLTNK